MIVLQVHKFYHPRGGAEEYVLKLSRLLESKGHTVIPFAMKHQKNLESPWSRFFPSFVKTFPPSLKHGGKMVSRMFYSFEVQRKLESLLDEVKPDIAHLHNLYHHLSPSILPVLERRGIPMVMTVHDYKLVCPNYILYTQGSTCVRCRGGKFYNAIRYRCLKNSLVASVLATAEMTLHHSILKIYERHIDRFIAPSDFVRKTLVEFGIDDRRIVVLGHFVDSLSTLSEPTRSDGPFLYVGRLSKEKGIDLLIEAVREIPGARLVIVGTGPLERSLRQIAAGGHIEFRGWLEGEKLEEAFRSSRAVVIPSRVWETFGLVALHAMAYGKPVIASRMGALPELVRDQETGWCFKSENREDLREKLEDCLKHPDRAQSMGRKGHEFVEQTFSSERHCEHLLQLYESLGEKKR